MTDPDEPTRTAAPGTAPAGPPAQPPGDNTVPADGQAKHRKPRSFWRELPFLIVIALVLALLIKTFLVQAFYIPSASMENTLMGGPPLGAPASPPDNPDRPYDRVLVNKLVYNFRDPHRGEIVVFKKPTYWSAETTPPQTTGIVHFFQDLESAVGIPVSSTEDIIKRVIGVPGDTVSCQARTGALQGKGYGDSVLTVNGHTLDENYLFPGSDECKSSYGYFTVKVPPGHLFVMGDHRNDSSDSRANWGATVPHGGVCNASDNWCGTIPINDVVGRAFLVIWPPSDWKGLGVPATFNQSGLQASGSVAPLLAPPALGLLGALPLTWLRRRRLLRRR